MTAHHKKPEHEGDSDVAGIQYYDVQQLRAWGA